MNPKAVRDHLGDGNFGGYYQREDAEMQAQVVNLLLDRQQYLNLTVAFVAHDLQLVRQVSHRMAVMSLGKVVEIATTDALFGAQRHPYTHALLNAAPELDPTRRSRTVNLLAWDSRTMMPPGGVDARSHQVTTLTNLARDLATGDNLRRAMDGAHKELATAPKSDIRLRALAQAKAEIGIPSRIPTQIISDIAGLNTHAHSAWAAARTDIDFAGFAPLLDRMMAMQREVAAAIGGAHACDPMIGQSEPSMTLCRTPQPL